MYIGLFIAALLPFGANDQEWPTLKGPYLGQKPPGLTPQIFAPGLVSLKGERELDSAFSPDAKSFMFTRLVDDTFKIYMTFEDGDRGWSKPKLIAPSRTFPGHSDGDPIFGPEGRRIYFISMRPLPGYSLERFNIWYSDLGPHGLQAPVPLGSHINGPDHELYPMVVGDGSLYFTANRGDGLGDRDSYRAQFRGGRFERPVNLGPAINSKHKEGDIFVNAEETLLIHSVYGRADDLGDGDLYISVRKKNGAWKDEVHLGSVINTDAEEYCPQITPDGRYFFFTRGDDVMWVDAKILDKFWKRESP